MRQKSYNILNSISDELEQFLMYSGPCYQVSLDQALSRLSLIFHDTLGALFLQSSLIEWVSCRLSDRMRRYISISTMGQTLDI